MQNSDTCKKTLRMMRTIGAPVANAAVAAVAAEESTSVTAGHGAGTAVVATATCPCHMQHSCDTRYYESAACCEEPRMSTGSDTNSDKIKIVEINDSWWARACI
jgi:hypothetical protein